ncbi:extracellular solute-binding protein [Hyphomicrobiaceae bacterium 22]|uniref:Extracellular solute-binding protein n=2 Tax=Prosthecodimorpha staleyi TaxID=2840188 RepID=A0A947D4L8_9HYPH|nr:extracellular solute-binding protein [Prosthecodimorpha staleyi]
MSCNWVPRLGVGFAMVVATAGAAAAAEVNVYTYREQPLIQPIFDQFTKETGIRVNVVFSNKGLEERIRAEGAASPADLFIAVDAAILEKAKAMGIGQPIKSAAVDKAVPAQFRDHDGTWVGLTYRARIFYVSKERVKDTSLTYADLADPKWKGKLCVRSGQHPYNIALIASMITHLGPDKTEAWLKGFKQNLAAKPSGNDRSQVKAVYSGECDIGVGNTYYYGLMATNEKEPEQKEWAKSVRVVMPTFASGGSHVNISGALLAKNAPNRDAALKLVEFMVGGEAQKLYAELNFEYPVVAGVAPTPLIADLGKLEADKASFAEIAKNRTKASELVDKVGFDDGPGS